MDDYRHTLCDAYSSLTIDQLRNITKATTLAAALSVLGAGFIIVSYIAFRRLRESFAQRLFLSLSIADFVLSAGYMISIFLPTSDITGVIRPGFLCTFQAIILQTFRLSSVLWTSCIAINVFNVVYFHDRDPLRLERRFHAVSWGVPVLLTVLLLLMRGLGPTFNKCLITCTGKYFHSYWLRIGFYYIPLAILMLGDAVVFGLVIQRFRYRAPKQNTAVQTLTEEPDELSVVFWAEHPEEIDQKSSVPRKLLLVLGVFVFIAMFPFIDRMYQLVYGTRQHTLAMLHGVMFPLQGFMNALVFGYSRTLRTECCGAFHRRRRLDRHPDGEGGRGGGRGGRTLELQEPMMLQPRLDSADALQSKARAKAAVAPADADTPTAHLPKTGFQTRPGGIMGLQQYAQDVFSDPHRLSKRLESPPRKEPRRKQPKRAVEQPEAEVKVAAGEVASPRPKLGAAAPASRALIPRLDIGRVDLAALADEERPAKLGLLRRASSMALGGAASAPAMLAREEPRLLPPSGGDLHGSQPRGARRMSVLGLPKRHPSLPAADAASARTRGAVEGDFGRDTQSVTGVSRASLVGTGSPQDFVQSLDNLYS
jgi:hypothetical protein